VAEQRRGLGAAERHGGRDLFLGTFSSQDKKKFLAGQRRNPAPETSTKIRGFKICHLCETRIVVSPSFFRFLHDSKNFGFCFFTPPDGSA
jgi:hypothetical protein